MKKNALFLAVAIVLCSFPFFAIASSDISEPAIWASEAVTYLEKYQLIPSELYSSYDVPIQRDEFAAVLMGVYNEAAKITICLQMNPIDLQIL